jgi:hypothetical protein
MVILYTLPGKRRHERHTRRQLSPTRRFYAQPQSKAKKQKAPTSNRPGLMMLPLLASTQPSSWSTQSLLVSSKRVRSVRKARKARSRRLGAWSEAHVDFGKAAPKAHAEGRWRPHVLRIALSQSRKTSSGVAPRPRNEAFLGCLEDNSSRFGEVPAKGYFP